MTNLEHALEYAEKLGWYVFPCWWVLPDGACACGKVGCKDAGKHPLGKVAPGGVWDASNEPKQIRHWWRKYPQANIAVHCGPSGIVATDLDSYKEIYEPTAVEKLISTDDTDTVTNLTPSGGQHLLYAETEAHYGNHNSLLPKGIDVRAWGAYIMVAPSNHVAGKLYEWEADNSPFDRKPAPLPAKLGALLDKMEAEAERNTAPVNIQPSGEKPSLTGLPTGLCGHINNGDAADRSNHDWGTVRELMRYGKSDQFVADVFRHYPIGIEGKYAEEGERYLQRTIAKARASIKPEDMRNGRHGVGFSADGETRLVDPETGEIMGAGATPHNGLYFVSKGRIGTFRTDKEGNETFIPLCNFNAWIAADISVDDGEHISRQVAIAGELPSGAKLKEIEIPADEFESMKWVISNWGAKVWVAPERGAKDRLRHAIQVLSADTMQERTSRAHTGWAIIDGKRVFLHAAGALGMDGVSVKLPSQLDGYRFPTDGAVDPVTAMRESIALLKVAPMKVSAPMWASMFAAPLTEINTPAFTVSVEGGSGSYKSSYSAVMLNHFGAGFSDKRMPADWLGTANSLEKLCFHAKDIPLVIDDFRPTTSITEGKALMEAVNRITRAAGNRQGRSRLDAGSDFKRSYAPRGLVMMTAERKALGKSTASRILTVDVAPGDIDTDLLTQAQKRRHVYGYAMAGFIQWVAANWEALSKSLPDFMMDTRSQGANLGYHKRLPEATAVLYTAFCCAMRYAVEIGAVDQDEAQHLKEDCYSVLQDIMEAQNTTTDSEDPAVKYLEILANLVAQNKAYIGAKGPNGIMLGITDGASEKLGWNDGHVLYLLPGAYNLVNRYARSEGWAFPSDESTLRKELHRAGCIAERDGDKLTKKVREPGAGKTATPLNVTAINLARFAEILIPMLTDDDTISALQVVINQWAGVPGM